MGDKMEIAWNLDMKIDINTCFNTADIFRIKKLSFSFKNSNKNKITQIKILFKELIIKIESSISILLLNSTSRITKKYYCSTPLN